MIEFIRSLFRKPGEDMNSASIKGENSKFILKIEDDKGKILEIGTLQYLDGKWKFQYSDTFQNQTKFRRLVGFSDLNKIYESEVLWPFFKIRIPGLKQPLVEKILEKEEIDKSDEVSLLKRFGRINISNPYVLDPVS